MSETEKPKASAPTRGQDARPAPAGGETPALPQPHGMRTSQRVAQTPPLRLRLVFGRTANPKAASAAQEPPFEEVALA